MYDITIIIEAFAGVILAILTTVIIPLVKARTTEQQQAQINTWVRIAVAAAEQTFSGSGRGAEKKAYVLAFLEKQNLTVDMNKIDAMIEAAVYEINNNGLIK